MGPAAALHGPAPARGGLPFATAGFEAVPRASAGDGASPRWRQGERLPAPRVRDVLPASGWYARSPDGSKSSAWNTPLRAAPRRRAPEPARPLVCGQLRLLPTLSVDVFVCVP